MARNLFGGRNLLAPMPASEEAMRDVARNLGDGSENAADRAAMTGAMGIPGLILGNEARRVAAGTFFNDVGENAARAGQWIGEKLGYVGPRDRARLESEMSVGDDAERYLEQERPGDYAAGRYGTEAAVYSVIPGGAKGGLIRRTVTGGLSGGMTAAASTRPDEDIWTRFFVGASFGAAAPVVVNGLSRAISRLAGKKVQAVVDGKLTDEAVDLIRKNDLSPEQFNQSVAKEMRAAGILSREEAKRFNLFQDFGLDPTKAQVTGKGSDFMRQQELAKGSNALRSQLDTQEAIIHQKVDDFIQALGGRSVDSVDAGNMVANAVYSKINAADSAIDEAYAAARSAAPDVKSISLKRLTGLIRARGPENADFAKALLNDLKLRGIVSDDGRLQGRISAEVAEEVRKNINALISESPRDRSRLGRMFKEAVDDDVASALGEDVFAGARSAKARLENSLNRARVTRRSRNAPTLLEEIIEDRASANPDALMQKVVRRSTRTVDVKQMLAFLRSGDAQDIEAGKAAIQEMRSAIVRDMFSKSLYGKTEDGIQMFSGSRFAKELDKIGNEKLAALFEPEQLTYLGQLRRIGEMRMPTTGSGTGMGPSAPAIAELAIDMADMKTAGLVRALRGALRIGRDSSDVSQFMNPAKGTEKALRISKRARPYAGSVGAVTADRLVEGTEE